MLAGILHHRWTVDFDRAVRYEEDDPITIHAGDRDAPADMHRFVAHMLSGCYAWSGAAWHLFFDADPDDPGWRLLQYVSDTTPDKRGWYEMVSPTPKLGFAVLEWLRRAAGIRGHRTRGRLWMKSQRQRWPVAVVAPGPDALVIYLTDDRPRPLDKKAGDQPGPD